MAPHQVEGQLMITPGVHIGQWNVRREGEGKSPAEGYSETEQAEQLPFVDQGSLLPAGNEPQLGGLASHHHSSGEQE